MKTRKSWREKLENPNLPKVGKIPAGMRRQLGTDTMLIPSPREVDALIRTLRRGELIGGAAPGGFGARAPGGSRPGGALLRTTAR